MRWKVFATIGRRLILGTWGFLWLFPTVATSQNISLEALRADGYGVATLQRPRSNYLGVTAEIDGHKRLLLVDTSWLGEGIGLLGASRGQTAASTTGSQIPLAPAGATVSLGNVQLTHVPVTHADLPRLTSPIARRTVGADGVIGAGFLRTCSAFLDLENLRLYLRPPGHGHRVKISGAISKAGLAQVPFQRTSAGACLVDAEINGLPVPMLIDTGAYLSGLDQSLAGKIQARPLRTNRGHPRPVAGEPTVVTRIDERSLEAYSLIENTLLTRLRSFKLGPVLVRAPDIRLQDLHLPAGLPRTVGGRLGIDILGPNGAIIDFPESILFVYPQ